MDARHIDFAVIDTRLGHLLVAASERGVCWVRFGESAEELERRLQEEFPFAPLRCDAARLAPWSRQLRRYMAGEIESLDMPLDVGGSRFERRVWAALRRIPRGSTRSYSEVARSLRMPRAARAVAQACAHNPVALIVPCHRVIAHDGSLGGYGGGIVRKRALLELEAGGLAAGSRAGRSRDTAEASAAP